MAGISDEVQQRRFGRSLRLLIEPYRSLLGHWRLFDNTFDDPHLIVEEKGGSFTLVAVPAELFALAAAATGCEFSG